MGAFKDLTNKRFNRLVAIKTVGVDKNKKIIWECLCDCGNTCNVTSNSLMVKDTQSCGCLKKESRKNRKPSLTHGGSGTRLYSIWKGVRNRCFYLNSKNYERYGGRGITVCEEWKDNFVNFRDWSLSNGYKEGLTIDRIDNNGNYEPSNCKWSTNKEQQNNKENNVLITYQNETKTLSQWAEEKGINNSALWGRYYKGWKDEKLFSEPDKRFSHHAKRKIND